MASLVSVGTARASLNHRDALPCQQQRFFAACTGAQASLKRILTVHNDMNSGVRLDFKRSGRYGALGTKGGASFVVRAGGEDSSAGNESTQSEVRYNTEFGYSRKDIILIGVGLIGLGYVLYYGLQTVFGMDAAMAGNWVQLVIFLGICVGWIGSYLFRVATKQMTYARQLDDYEEAVMKKRLEELPETELENMMQNVEEEKERVRQRLAEREAEGE